LLYKADVLQFGRQDKLKLYYLISLHFL